LICVLPACGNAIGGRTNPMPAFIFGSPRRWRDDRRHESDRSHHRRRAEEGADAGDRDERRNRPSQDAQARRDGPDPVRGDGTRRNGPDPVRWDGKRPDDADPARWEGKRSDDPDPVHREGKPPSDVKDDLPVRHERSPRGTKRFSETREAWQPRSSFFQVLVFTLCTEREYYPHHWFMFFAFSGLIAMHLTPKSVNRSLNVLHVWSSSNCQFLCWFSLESSIFYPIQQHYLPIRGPLGLNYISSVHFSLHFVYTYITGLFNSLCFILLYFCPLPMVCFVCWSQVYITIG
jgi:hypothetical protein